MNDNQLSGNIPAAIDSLLAYTYVYNNKFTFKGMEGLAQRSVYTSYAPQANIPIIQSDSILSVEAGGTISNNTYKWYKNGILISTKTGNKKLTT